VYISETTEASKQQHHITITQHTTTHEPKHQPTNDSDTEITEEYTTKFRRGSKENETAAIKTKKTTIRKKKPKTKSEEEKIVVIEEEIGDITSQVPFIPKKQLMHIEEVTGLIGIEEIVPTKIEELEERTVNQKEEIETLIQKEGITEIEEKQSAVITNYIKERPVEEIVEEIVLKLSKKLYFLRHIPNSPNPLKRRK